MLTSKEIIERTGISRATLNNYIASGLVPRPQVLPPGPQDGAAPRIGYFPDDTVARIELEPEDMPRALELREEITAGITEAGYAFVTLDLGGFKSGNLNKLLKPTVIAASTRG